MKQFSEFRETLTDEVKTEISDSVRNVIASIPESDDSIDRLVACLATMSFNYSLFLLERYHKWLSTNDPQ